MPCLNIRLSTPPSAQIPAQLATMLTELTASVLGKKRELTAVVIETVSPDQWFIGGQSLVAQNAVSFQLDLKITEGTNTKDQKAAYVMKVYGALEALLGALHPASYIVIHEVRADAWGYQGETQENRYIRGKSL